MICWAIKNGVPWDRAHDMDIWELLAYSITFSQFEGAGEWDWDTMSFLEKPP